MKKIIQKLLINDKNSIKETIKSIDCSGFGIAFVVDINNKFQGLVTDGDIRREILKGTNIEKTSIIKIMHKNPILIKQKWNKEKLQKHIKKIKSLLTSEYQIIKVPVLNKNEKVVDIKYFSKNSFNQLRPQEITENENVLQKSSIKKILIIGGAGYLGSILCRKLLEKGYFVRVLDNFTYGDKGIKDLHHHQNFEVIEGDIRNLQIVMECLKGMDTVIHLAAIVGDSASELNPQETIEINYLSTKMIAEACKLYQINRFIFASTCSVYGINSISNSSLNEKSDLNPISLYADMKLKSEGGIFELMDENFSPTILRLSTLFGYSSRMRFDLVVNLFTAKAYFDKEIIIFGGNQWRPNLHVQDAASAFLKCLETPIEKIKGEIFNVGSNDLNFRINEIADIINQIIPEAKIKRNKKKTDKRDYKISFDKIKKFLDFKPIYSLNDGTKEIKDMIEKTKIVNYKDNIYNNYESLVS